MIETAQTVNTLETCAKGHHVIVSPVILDECMVNRWRVMFVLAADVLHYDFALSIHCLIDGTSRLSLSGGEIVSQLVERRRKQREVVLVAL
jgi:hypothetical protein